MARSKSKSANAGRDTRRSTNILILLATFAILFVAVDLTDGSFANSIDKINRNLEVALRDLGENMPDYSNYSDAQVYLSTNATFNPSAMAGLYNLTRRFIDWIGKDILMNVAYSQGEAIRAAPQDYRRIELENNNEKLH
ncbi:unnamed protein product [Phaedon cochleariae]|uniref:Uncharacterized protein n=1 Tax=Phaedon cochleariae TaxID=80249 RepID=A0A9N9X594_PHACE|nr:unnamed protein product [Phaedon cochleariae]